MRIRWKFGLRGLIIATTICALVAFLVSLPITERRKTQQFRSQFVTGTVGDNFSVFVSKKLDQKEQALLDYFSNRVVSLEVFGEAHDSLKLSPFVNLENLAIPKLSESALGDLKSLTKLESVSISEAKLDRSQLLSLLQTCQSIDVVRASFELKPLVDIQALRPNDKIWISQEWESNQWINVLAFERGARIIPVGNLPIGGEFEIGMSLREVQQRISKPVEKSPCGIYAIGSETEKWKRETPKFALEIREKMVILNFNFYDEVIQVTPLLNTSEESNATTP